MSNILYDEKKFLNEGEICAVELKNIKPLYIYVEPDKSINFFSQKNGASSGEEITFIKYLGNGIVEDLVTSEKIHIQIFDGHDIGSNEYYALQNDSRQELDKIGRRWIQLQGPETLDDFKTSFTTFTNNPLVIDIESTPFMSIDSQMEKQFASQSLSDIEDKINSTKQLSITTLKQQLAVYEENITNYYEMPTILTTKTRK